jgi:hypothetical protein
MESFLHMRNYDLRVEVSHISPFLHQNLMQKSFLKHSLRRRLGNALQWYTHLIQVTDAHIDAFVADRRPSAVRDAPSSKRIRLELANGGDARPVEVTTTRPPEHTASPAVTPSSTGAQAQACEMQSPILTPQLGRKRSLEDDSSTNNSATNKVPDTAQDLTFPSEYLRQRCPLCFTCKMDLKDARLAAHIFSQCIMTC